MHRLLTALLAGLCVAVSLSACGGSSKITPEKSVSRPAGTSTTQTVTTGASQTQPTVTAQAHLPPGVVVRVRGTEITKAALNYWMTAFLGGDFYEGVKLTAPKGLITDPVDYETCQAGVVSMETKRNPRAKPPKRDPRQICETLHSLIVTQTLGYLIAGLRNIGQAAELGLTVSNQEVAQEFKKLRAQNFPTEAELATYLNDRDWTLRVELFLIKQDLVNRKLNKVLTKGSEYADFVKRETQKWTRMTSCRAGYVSEGCPGYKEPTEGAPSPGEVSREIIGYP